MSDRASVPTRTGAAPWNGIGSRRYRASAHGDPNTILRATLAPGPLDTACMIFDGALDRHGYGKIGFAGRPWEAHRLVWWLHGGVLPEGLLVRHHCDTPPCCNVTHLALGTRWDNAADMVARERQARGTGHGRAKLTDDDVRAIRRRYAAGGVLQRELADEYGVTASSISQIVNRQTWRHVR